MMLFSFLDFRCCTMSIFLLSSLTFIQIRPIYGLSAQRVTSMWNSNLCFWLFLNPKFFYILIFQAKKIVGLIQAHLFSSLPSLDSFNTLVEQTNRDWIGREMDKKKILTWCEQTFQAKNLHTRPVEKLAFKKLKLALD